MKSALVFAFVACCAASALSLTEDDKNSIPSATMSSAEQFSHDPTTHHKHTTTTLKPTTTTKPTTTLKPTTKPTTTLKPTTKPTTTLKPTTKPTTPKPTTKPTTPKPTPTTKPTTTPKPTPPRPTPSVNITGGNYTVMTDNNVTCLMAQMSLRIRLATAKANGSFIVQPKMTAAEGGCKGSTARLTLVFKEGNITFMFNKSADNTVYVDALSFNLSYPLTAGQTQYTAHNKSLHLFPAKVGHSYSCRRETVSMGYGLFLDVDQDTLQAFNLTRGGGFGSPEPCSADRPDYRVAIAVGVTLLVLIVVVVVAYLLGRRRRANGYQSL
ncbi:macrosialin-like isoform X2 [Pseudoliparis swirei]|uniref:macrosialin-like isoform X2 n=1 Tax=Pseudoliparis swirei TaxID=2059687 RepID=UPI0024BE38D3|nr:macrosialin-like isoform X2 [Pseudoliparis swirei]